MKRILLIDDCTELRVALSTYLSHKGWDVVEAENGREGIDTYLKEPSISLIILDLFMPVMDGIEVLEYFHGQGNLPIVVISGGSPEGVQLLEVAKELGAIAIIEKPFAPSILIPILEDALGPISAS